MTPIRIGVPQSGYNVDRNLKVIQGRVQYVRPWDFWRVVNGMNYRIAKDLNPRHQFTFSKNYFPKVNVLHFFNSISYSNTPWFSTFETSMPRWGPGTHKKGLQLLLREEAKGFIALSQASKDIFLNDIQSQMTSSEVELIQSKTIVMHPPQTISSEDFVRNQRIQRLGLNRRSFCFVGTDFYRKGGYEMLRAFERLFDAGEKGWKLVIVGDFNSFGDFASLTTRQHKWASIKILEKLKEHVSHFQRMSSSDVQKLFKKSDFLVFPTIQDTYGYVLLEAMAQGCVPIVSNQRAIPELIQHRKNGLMFEVPLNRQYSAVPFYQSSTGSDTYIDFLFERLSDALAMDATKYSGLSLGAFNSIKENHNPQLHANRLMELYLKACPVGSVQGPRH